MEKIKGEEREKSLGGEGFSFLIVIREILCEKTNEQRLKGSERLKHVDR